MVTGMPDKVIDKREKVSQSDFPQLSLKNLYGLFKHYGNNTLDTRQLHMT